MKLIVIMNDHDKDGLCGNIDSCPNDAGNDHDSDMICGDKDSCRFDPRNDIDSDKICGEIDICEYDDKNEKFTFVTSAKVSNEYLPKIINYRKEICLGRRCNF